MEKNIYNVIFPLLRSTLWGEEKYPFTCEEDVNWEEVNKELKEQTIHYLPIDILSRVDNANRTLYYIEASSALRSWHTLMQEQQNLCVLLQKENIPFVILKGSAANYYYPKPIYRCMGDIDFIVKPEDFIRTTICMNESGYLFVNSKHSKHYEYTKNGVSFELHHHFSLLKDEETELWQDNLIFSAINHSTMKDINGFTFPMLPVLENGLVLLTHINQHMELGLGLRQIIDWMMYVDKEMTDEYWNTTFCPATEKIGLKTLAITVTKMCQMYLGLTKELLFCQDADASLCEYLMQYVIEQGNFGRKRGDSHNTAIRTLGINNPFSLYSTLQKRGLQNWSATTKHPILRPFAWIYQIGRYIHLGFKRDKPLKQLKADYLQGKMQEDFLNRLEVRRTVK